MIADSRAFAHDPAAALARGHIGLFIPSVLFIYIKQVQETADSVVFLHNKIFIFISIKA